MCIWCWYEQRLSLFFPFFFLIRLPSFIFVAVNSLYFLVYFEHRYQNITLPFRVEVSSNCYGEAFFIFKKVFFSCEFYLWTNYMLVSAGIVMVLLYAAE